MREWLNTPGLPVKGRIHLPELCQLLKKGLVQRFSREGCAEKLGLPFLLETGLSSRIHVQENSQILLKVRG